MKVHVETWGCQMNTVDSERMLAILAERQYGVADSANDADLILLNTCHIREKARHKVLTRLGELKELKANNPKLRIAVAGCVAQAEGMRLLKQAPQIDILFGPGKIDELPRLLDERELTRKAVMATGFKKTPSSPAAVGGVGDPSAERSPTPPTAAGDDGSVSTGKPLLTGKNEVSRFVNIQQGCNNYCTFCVVPFTRGREISRMPGDILMEARQLIAHGAKEITVLGQNVNSYGTDLVEAKKLTASSEGPFYDLLKELAAVPEIQRVRFTTSNPHDFSPGLARLFGEEPKLAKYIHLPVQSGNDRMLEVMKRKVTVAEYRQRVAWLRAAVPDMAISTDLIVGFPGETDEEFEDTLKLVADMRYSFSFNFKYSPRKNTPAARYQDQVPEDVKAARLARLNALQDKITLELNAAEIGQTREVMFVYQSKRFPGQYFGRTEHFRLVRVNSDRDLCGQVLPVVIDESSKTSLVGKLQSS
jgi:tRNA-2-methylthio-N6-dimethylallyladenosine synthase